MPKITDVTIFDNSPHSGSDDENRLTIKGREYGPWIIVNRGLHLKWGIYDAGSGMRLVHALPTLKTAERIIERINELDLNLVLSEEYEHPEWATACYTQESLRNLSEWLRAFQANLEAGAA